MRIYVDMDGVLVKGPTPEKEKRAREKWREEKGEQEPEPEHWSDLPDMFFDLEPMEGAIESFNELYKQHEVYILTTVPWENTSAWSDKKRWVEKHLPCAKKRLIYSHHKNLLNGDILIDDRLKNGSEKFEGTLVHFGQEPFENWGKVMERSMEWARENGK